MLELTTEQKKFEFSVDGVVYSVTALESIPYERTKAVREMTSDNEAARWIADEIFEKEAPKAMQKITSGQWAQILSAYLSKVTPGESQA